MARYWLVQTIRLWVVDPLLRLGLAALLIVLALVAAGMFIGLFGAAGYLAYLAVSAIGEQPWYVPILVLVFSSPLLIWALYLIWAAVWPSLETLLEWRSERRFEREIRR